MKIKNNPTTDMLQNGNENLRLLMDFLKFSWDLFIKGHAFYLFSISIMGGFAFSAQINWFQKTFVGLAICGASIIAFIATNVSLKFISDITQRIDQLCIENNYVAPPFSEHVQIVIIFRYITLLLFFTGVLYLIHVFLLEGFWPDSPLNVLPQPEPQKG